MIVTLAACGGESHSPSPEGSREKVVIRFPTAGASGALYAVGAAITNLWDTEIDYVSASSQASNGGIDNLNQVADGEAQVSIAISSNCYQSFHGTDSFEGYANEKLRVMGGLYFNPNQVVVTEKSGITALGDVKGKHFAVAAAAALRTMRRIFYFIKYRQKICHIIRAMYCVDDIKITYVITFTYHIVFV